MVAVALLFASFALSAEAGCQAAAVPVFFNESDQQVLVFYSIDRSTRHINVYEEKPRYVVEPNSDEYLESQWGGCDNGTLVARTLDGALIGERTGELCDGDTWTFTQTDVDTAVPGVPQLVGPYETFENASTEDIKITVYSNRLWQSSGTLRPGEFFYYSPCKEHTNVFVNFKNHNKPSINESGEEIDYTEMVINYRSITCGLGEPWVITDADLVNDGVVPIGP